MRKKLALGATAALALATPLAAARIGWTATPGAAPGRVRLTIERTAPGSRSTDSDDIDAGRLKGLRSDADGPVHFALVEEAGRLDCSGIAARRQGAGDCRLTVDPRFSEALRQRGIGQPDDAEGFALVVHGVRLAFVDALIRSYGRPDLGQLIALSIHGADPAWLDGIAVARGPRPSVGELIAYRIHGVGGAWLAGLLQADPVLRHASAGEIIALRIHGATPEWARGMADAGFRDIPAGDLIALRIHGITPEFARAAARMDRLGPGDLVALKITGRRP